MATCILVLGTPRSGTSCVGGILHHLGVPMGTRLLPASDWNPAGFFQDADFDDILNAALGRGQWPAWTTSKPSLTGTYAKQIKALAASRTGVWGLKSNRIVHYLNALKSGAGTLKVIRTQRPIEGSVASWAARTGYADGHPMNPVRAMEAAVRNGLTQMGITPLVVDYNLLLSNTAAEVGKIAAFAGRPVTQAAIDFVDASLRRYGDG